MRTMRQVATSVTLGPGGKAKVYEINPGVVSASGIGALAASQTLRQTCCTCLSHLILRVNVQGNCY